MVGDLRISGSLIAENYIVSSSTTYYTQSYYAGSTQFGDSVDDTHTFTGSIHVSSSQNTLEIVASSSHGTPMVKLTQVSGSNSGEFLHMVNHQGFPAIQFNQGYHGQCSWHMYGSGSYGGNTPVLCHQFQDASTGGDSFVNYSAGSSSTNYFGINTNDPTTTLTVEGDISASGFISASGNIYAGGDLYGGSLYLDGGRDIKIKTGDIIWDALSFDNVGNINTDVQFFKEGHAPKITIKAGTSTPGDAIIRFWTPTNANAYWSVGADVSEETPNGSTFGIRYGSSLSDDAQFVMNDFTGNTGIGGTGTSPSSTLTVQGDISASGYLSVEGNITASGGISASGDLYVGGDITGSLLMLDFDRMPTSDPGIKGAVYRISVLGMHSLRISAG
jgi:cytoskeletal protein CcmA (bactofilin family)